MAWGTEFNLDFVHEFYNRMGRKYSPLEKYFPLSCLLKRCQYISPTENEDRGRSDWKIKIF